MSCHFSTMVVAKSLSYQIIHMAEIKCYIYVILHILCAHSFQVDEKCNILKMMDSSKLMIKFNRTKLVIPFYRYLNRFNFVYWVHDFSYFLNFIN